MGNSPRLQIVVCEPDATTRDRLVAFLERLGARAHALDQVAALPAALRTHQPQLLMVALPADPAAAESLLRGVREYDRDLCLIALARVPSVETAVAAMKHQAFEYLRHPLDENTLRKTVDAAVEEKGLLVSLEQRLNREIGQQVRGRRGETGLTLRQVATRTGLSVSLISQIELGKSAASISTLYKLSRALHVKMGHFFEA